MPMPFHPLHRRPRTHVAGRAWGWTVFAVGVILFLGLSGISKLVHEMPQRRPARGDAGGPAKNEAPAPANFRTSVPDRLPPRPVVARNAPAPVAAADPHDLSAMVEAGADEIIPSPQNGRLKEFPPPLGARLRSGSTLFVLDGAAAEADLERARAVRDAARVALEGRAMELERMRDLHDRQLATTVDFENSQQAAKEADAALAVAEAEVKVAESAQRSTATLLPFDGVVVGRHAEVGEVVMTGQPVVTVRRLRPR